MATNSSRQRVVDRVRGKPTIAYHVVKAHPRQPMSTRDDDWTWGDEWQIGDRRGRWAISVNSILETDLVRVEWADAAPILRDDQFYHELVMAIHAPAESDVADARGRAMEATRSFDRMAAGLWERQSVSDDR